MKLARRLFFVALTVSLMFESGGGFALQQIGWYIQQDLKKWLPLGIPFSLLELCLIASAALWLARTPGEKRRYHFQPGRALIPMLCFAGALAVGVLWGLFRSGDNLTFALFEIRAPAIMVFGYLLVGMLLHDEEDLNHLVWCVLIACTYLTLDNLQYYFLVLQSVGITDLAYDHDDSVVLGFGFVLCLAILAFGGTRAQRRYALILPPVIIFCLMLMQRRAAFAVLAVGIIAMAIVYYRLRPKLFWRVIPPLALLLALYLAAFWNNTSIVGQPARAIRSMYSPDPRDASSNLYRDTERSDILANIATSRYLGLGFGQEYIFYYPLPDVGGFWPFWRYTSHNSVLWLWMDGGIPVFLTFWWVAGSGAYAGGQELALRRKAWSKTRTRLRKAGRLGNRSDVATPHVGETAQLQSRMARTRHEPPNDGAAEHIPAPQTRRQARLLRHGVNSTSTAVLAAGMCLIIMHVTYSYVELGMQSGRLMLVLGVMLGVLGRTFAPRLKRSVRRMGEARSLVVASESAGPAGMTPPDSSVTGVQAREYLASVGERRP